MIIARRVARRPFARRIVGLFALGYALLCGLVPAAGAGSRGLAAVFGLCILGVLVVGVVQAIARLHDRDRTGWWLGLYAGVSVLDLLPTDTAFDAYPIPVGAYVLATLTFEIWLLLDLFGRPGTPGPNRFGPAP